MDIIILFVCALPCLWLILRRCIHLFQLESYQFPGYMRALETHSKKLYSATTFVPMALYIICGIFFPYAAIAATGLFVLVNPIPKMKKPLVYTPRVRRLAAASILLSTVLAALPTLWLRWVCGVFFSAGTIFARSVWSIFMAAAVLSTPRLLIFWGRACAPMEKAISNHYIKDAKRILREHTNLITIGITGSFGKTSTKFFLNELLSQKYNVYMTPGNFNTTLGVTRAVREGLNPTHEIFICEMGARHKGDIAEICELAKPQIGIITSVGRQHLETFYSMETVLSTKLELHDAVKADGVTFVNTDSKYLNDALDTLEGKVFTCGENGGYCAKNITAGKNGLSFTLCTPNGESEQFVTKLLGNANVQNLTLAIACAHHLGVSLKQMVPVVRALRSVPHRLELKHMGDTTIIDDAYNSNPTGARMALDALSVFSPCRVLITPGLVELGEYEYDENRALAKYAADKCDLAIIVGRHNRFAFLDGLADGGMDQDKIITVKTINDGLKCLPAGSKTVLLLNDLPDNYR